MKKLLMVFLLATLSLAAPAFAQDGVNNPSPWRYGASGVISYLNGSVGIGTSVPGFAAIATRTYLTLQGQSPAGVGVLQLANFAAGNGNNGNIEWYDIGNTSAVPSTRSALITSGSSGSSPNNLGSFISLDTKPDGGAIQLVLNLDSAGSIQMPKLAASSASQTGTVCWTTGTGNLTVDTTTTCLLSSAQFKHDIRPLKGSLETVLALQPVSYVYNDDVFIPGEQVGLVAEDVAAVDKRLVANGPDGKPRSVRYQQLTADLIGAIQAQQKDIESLKSRKWCLAGYCW